MAKQKEYYLCKFCSYKSLKWLGRCPSCFEWESFLKTQENTLVSQDEKSNFNLVSLNDIKQGQTKRFSSSILEFDRVLGGGIVLGSAILIVGEPGIGKSTFLLQLSNILALKNKVLYLSGEESASQIKMRAKRLGVSSDILITNELNVEILCESLREEKIDFIIVDSIQTLKSKILQASLGSISLLKHCIYHLIEWAKKKNITLFLIGHITKEGIVAGPKLIEHMVDTVLYFESANVELRMLRASKNRFGAINELGIFEMTQKGLLEIENPSSLFLSKREENPIGVVIAVVNEGSRLLFLEVQALVVNSQATFSRVYSDKIDSKRISRLCAILDKYLNLNFSNNDIYINVAGGFKVSDVELDLALLSALISAKIDLKINSHFIFTGELSLAGEIKPPSKIEAKMLNAKKAGFKKVIGGPVKEINSQDYFGVQNIRDLIKILK